MSMTLKSLWDVTAKTPGKVELKVKLPDGRIVPAVLAHHYQDEDTDLCVVLMTAKEEAKSGADRIVGAIDRLTEHISDRLAGIENRISELRD